MDILFFLLPLHPYSKVYIQYGYQKDCRGKDSSMEKNCFIAENAVLTLYSWRRLLHLVQCSFTF